MKKKYVFLALIILLALIVYSFFYEEKNNFEKSLLENWEDNSYIKLSTLLKKDFDLACIVHPYSSNIYYKLESNEVNKMNNYLDENDFSLGEGKWAIVVLNANNVEILTISRRYIDLKDNNKLVDSNYKSCVDSAKGVLYLHSKKDRKLTYLGEK